MRCKRAGIAGTVLGIAGCWVLPGAASALPPELAGYDPSRQIRFATTEQADAKRRELITYVWPDGLPADRLPAVTRNIGREVFAGDLGGLDGALAAAVERLDAEVAPYEFHGISYLVRPRAVNANNRRLVMLNSGHRKDGPFAYGVNDAANRLLDEGFAVLMTDMPLVGFNTCHTVKPPDGGATITIGQRGTAGHNELFDKLATGKLPGGTIFRLFLEPLVQGVNHFLRVTPDAADVSFVGLSGGGWSVHMLAALDPRIKQSFPVAGSYPLYARPPGMSHDAEQFHAPLYCELDDNGDGIADAAAGVASWLEIYALGGYGAGRRQIQILNLYDSCCFSGDTFKTYDNFVAGIVRKLAQGEWGFHSDASHRSHLISPVVLNHVIMPRLLGTAGLSNKQAAGAGGSATDPATKSGPQPALTSVPTIVEAAASDALPDRHRVTLKTIDLSGEANPADFKRHVVLAGGVDDEDWQHPHMLLMPDGKTLFAVWTRGHGGTCGPLKRSDDGGLTWSGLLDVPENWHMVKNCPTIHRLGRAI